MTRLPVLTVLVVALVASLALVSGAGAKVVNENTDDLPPGCAEISDEVELTVTGGRSAARGIPGVVYTFDRHSWTVPTCARVTVTFNNTDQVRHQFMPHGVWPDGFMVIEVDGPGEDTGTFITPSKPSTIMVHCGVAQHPQKGMKAQLLVGGGVGDLPNVPTVSGLPDAATGDVDVQAEDADRPVPAPSGALLAVALTATALLIARREPAP